MDHDRLAKPTRTEFLPYSPPTLGDEEIEEVVATALGGAGGSVVDGADIGYAAARERIDRALERREGGEG